MTGRDDGRQPWERMPGETDKAFAKFCQYRDLGPTRSLARLRQVHGGKAGFTRGALEQLCRHRRWVARASAWDDEQDRGRRQAQAEAIREMAERQAKDGLDMQRLARGAMGKWVQRDPQTGQMVLATPLSPSEVTRLYRLGCEVERLARGEPTQVTEQKVTAEEIYDEDQIAAGIAYALAQAAVDAPGMGGSGEENRLPVSAATEPDPVDGGPALDSGQAEPDGPAAPEPDPAQA